jgi:hypothetical protein
VLEGPDSIFRQAFLTASTQNVTPFIGTGNVSLTFSNKALTGVNGSNNFSLQINTNTDVTLQITYFFCSAVGLPTLFDELQVKKDGDNAVLDWGTRSESGGMAFRVEASEDGNHFHGIATLPGKGLTLSKYEYVEPLTVISGKRYYRIAIISPDGVISYSMIRSLDWGGARTGGLSAYPNPAGRQFTLRLGKVVNHSVQWQLFSMAGQMLETHAIATEGYSEIPVSLNRNYPAGSYVIKLVSPEGGTDGLCRIVLAD